MIIIAIDPGYDRVGYAILEKDKNSKEKILFSDCIHTNKKESIYERFAEIAKTLYKKIKEYTPEYMVLESLFFSKNTKTALQVSEARGVIIAQALRSDLRVIEYTPNQIKVAVTGYGNAVKNDMYTMVQRLIKLEQKKYIDDEIDAIAIGITFFATQGYSHV